MAVRVFDGVDDEVRFPVPAELTGACTFAVLYKSNALGAWHALMGNYTSGSAATISIELNTANLIWMGSVAQATALAVTPSDGWVVIAATKAAGTATPRMHRYVLQTDTMTHSAGSGAIENGGATVGGTVRLGEWQDGDDANGKMAVCGEWNVALSDVEVEALVTNLATTDWVNHAVTPVWVVEPGMNTPVEDLIGANDSTVINGTTISSADEPDWTFGLAPPAPPGVGTPDFCTFPKKRPLLPGVLA